MFGLDAENTAKAAEVCGILGREWRALVAGREGFLTGRKRAGLVRQAVVWGEMDCMVCLVPSLGSCHLWMEKRRMRKGEVREKTLADGRGIGTCE